MIRNGVRAGWAARVLSVFVLAPLVSLVLIGASVQAMDSVPSGRRPLTPEEGARVAEAALAYAELEFTAAGTVYTGMPYLWGGRTTVDEFAAAVSGTVEDVYVTHDGTASDGDMTDVASSEEDAVPATAPAASFPTSSAAAVSGLGVDASGVAVNALRSLGTGVRFAATAGDDPVWWADATSALLHDFNVVEVDPIELRAGDLVFFGGVLDGDVYVSGVGVVTGRTGTRVDFVVASARAGRVIHTFARTDGDYWQGNIVGAGRFLVRD